MRRMTDTPRTRIRTDAQRAYWNALAPEYARITRIREDDFHWGPQIPGESVLRVLPPLGPGSSALEIGCGEGQNSVFLAKRGVLCEAIDVSESQLAFARAVAASAGVRIAFRRASIEDFAAGPPPDRPFDLVHSSHALEFVQDPAAAVRAMAAAAKRGGTVAVSTVHPLFNGEWIQGEWEDESGGGAGDAGAGLFLRDYFSPPDDVRDDGFGHAVSRAWPVSAWFGWFRDAGLEVTTLLEPPATADAPYTSDDWADHGGQLDRIPSTLVIAGVKR
jgi:SAM-dependent methyltransferase